MVSLQTPVCDFGWNAPDFDLPGVDGKRYSLSDVRGPNGLLVMFICNHCPYVKAVRDRLVRDCAELKTARHRQRGHHVQRSGRICRRFLRQHEESGAEFAYPFPYLLDETQQVAQGLRRGVHAGFLRLQRQAGTAVPRPARCFAQGSRARPMRGATCSRPWCRWPKPARGRRNRFRAWAARLNGKM